jgi:glycosyltransferase involved in cell wall biosynthesis
MKSFGVPVTATIHHPLTIDLENYLERAPNFTRKIRTAMFYPVVMQRIVSKLLDHIITVSEDSKRTNNRHFGIPLEKQTVVLNGIDTDVFHIDHGVRKVRGKILFVGNVEDGKKGFQYLLRAMALVKSRVKLVVVDGCSPHRIMTNMLMDRLKLHDRVVFVGKTSIEELVRHYNESEIAVVPSVHEGFGFPAGEAMACGVPVISSDGGALPEVVGDAGIIVPSRDEAVIAHAIDVLADDPGLRHRIGRAGLARVKKLFRWDAAVSQMIGVFERCIKEKTGTV